jgi:hypothetical protein
MRARLLVLVVVAMWLWAVPAAHTMPVDADGPSGLSDNGDFDDVILSITSPTLATATPLVLVPWASFIALGMVVPLPTTAPSRWARSVGLTRAPPRA